MNRLSYVNQRNGRPKRGVSLTELMVGVGIIALALIPIVSSLISSMKSTNAGNMEVNAALIGSSILETMVNSLRIDEITNDMELDPLSGVTDEDGSSTNNEVKYEDTTYKLTLTVNKLKNNEVAVSFRQIRAGLFGKTKFEYAKPPLDVKSHIAKDWKLFKTLNLYLSSFKQPSPSLIEIFLEIRWTDPKGKERVYNFYTRKARLE
jgi:hypothetical protein